MEVVSGVSNKERSHRGVLEKDPGDCIRHEILGSGRSCFILCILTQTWHNSPNGQERVNAAKRPPKTSTTTSQQTQKAAKGQHAADPGLLMSTSDLSVGPPPRKTSNRYKDCFQLFSIGRDFSFSIVVMGCCACCVVLLAFFQGRIVLKAGFGTCFKGCIWDT